MSYEIWAVTDVTGLRHFADTHSEAGGLKTMCDTRQPLRAKVEPYRGTCMHCRDARRRIDEATGEYKPTKRPEDYPQDEPSPAAIVRGYAAARERAESQREYAAEQAASAQYEELRLLTRPELEQRAGFSAPRQQLIAHLILKEAS